MIEVELLGAPMGKERPRFDRRTGRAYTPERTLNYEARLAHRAQDVMAGRPLLTGPLKVELIAYLAIPESKSKKWKADALAGSIIPIKKPDWDNFGKILDACNLIVWEDDAQIADGRVQKFYSDRPRLVLRVSEMTTDNCGVFG